MPGFEMLSGLWDELLDYATLPQPDGSIFRQASQCELCWECALGWAGLAPCLPVLLACLRVGGRVAGEPGLSRLVTFLCNAMAPTAPPPPF